MTPEITSSNYTSNPQISTFIGKIGQKNIIAITIISALIIIGSLLALALKIYRFFISKKQEEESVIKMLREKADSSERKIKELEQKLTRIEADKNTEIPETAKIEMEEDCGEILCFVTHDGNDKNFGLNIKEPAKDIKTVEIVNEQYTERAEFTTKADGSVIAIAAKERKSGLKVYVEVRFPKEEVENGDFYEISLYEKELFSTKYVIVYSKSQIITYTIIKNNWIDAGITVLKNRTEEDPDPLSNKQQRLSNAIAEYRESLNKKEAQQ